jgi:DNA-binding transcriptional LysR family regulator
MRESVTENLRYKEIQLPQLRSFCLAATDGNSTTAAKTLGLSASTVWQQVRSLERVLKSRLMRRQGRAVELTEEGRLLLDAVLPHVNGLESLPRLFESLREGIHQDLVLATTPYLSANLLPKPILIFHNERPTIQLSLRIAVSSALHRLLEEGTPDLGVIACDPEVPRSARLEYEHLLDLQLCLMIPDNHHLMGKKRITLAELANYPLILSPKGEPSRRAFNRLMRLHNLDIRPVLECGLVDVAKHYVLAGMGIGILYLNKEVSRSTPGLHIRAIDTEVERLSIEIAVRKGIHLPSHVDEFRRILRMCFSGKGSAAT